MKKIVILLLLFSWTVKTYSQPLPDTTKAKYYAAKTDKEKGECLMDYFKHQPLKDTHALVRVSRTKDELLRLYFGVSFKFIAINIYASAGVPLKSCSHIKPYKAVWCSCGWFCSQAITNNPKGVMK